MKPVRRSNKQMQEWVRFALRDFAKTPYVLQVQLEQSQMGQAAKEPSGEASAHNATTAGDAGLGRARASSGARDTAPHARGTEADWQRPVQAATSTKRAEQAPEVRRGSAESAHMLPPQSGRGTQAANPARKPVDHTQRRVYAVVRQAGFATSVLDEYTWQPTSAEAFRGVIHVVTPEGDFALKQTNLSPGRVTFVKHLMDHARKHGFEAFAPLALTRKGKPYVTRKEHVYYATQWIPGQQANFSSVQQVGQIAHVLARFHEATRGFTSEAYSAQPEFDLVRMIRRRRNELYRILAEAERKRDPDRFDTTLLELAPALRQDADDSLELVQQTSCEAFLKADAKRPGICHLDVIPGNFVYDLEKRIILIDLDLATYAPRVLDLAHLLRRSLQQQYWSAQAAYACFLHYDTVRTITPGEYDLVTALLRFPYRAWRLARTRYQGMRDTFQVDELQAYQSQEPRRQAFLSALADEITRLQS
ncbi:phosphotransferase [Alicyclobacillus cycloheptanicus]|uniref:CotS family spore coat protein n=1 Tax=Alicyclobacillus cycloheptanicus TaxID=1457 RepID=A0ABT9XM19_9BACL|nr:phosphotransferase [Alicyclobacillus cycloheptanicus]MDQ0190741.1 CotS family spore coat protein [Alicyclobacillus cycloheptanicus]WDL99869.1 phosphotransferase [Alicyclobacillus cycloheptanicus]